MIAHVMIKVHNKMVRWPTSGQCRGRPGERVRSLPEPSPGFFSEAGGLVRSDPGKVVSPLHGRVSGGGHAGQWHSPIGASRLVGPRPDRSSRGRQPTRRCPDEGKPVEADIYDRVVRP